jgi:alkaline phosphatase D
MSGSFTRRRFLAGSAAVAAAAALPVGCTPAPIDPFTLGVASGDPTPDGFVIWSRLATNPAAADGFGGMGNATVQVDWQVATDSAFAHIVRSGTTWGVPAYAHSLHVQLAGLQPAYVYYYRFKANGFLSPVGRTRTAPATTSAASLLLGAVSCAHYEDGYFTAYRRLAADAPDVIVHLGDYIYEYPARPVGPGVIRSHLGGTATTLANYRQRYAQYHTDPDLQAAHAAAPWLCIPDDHEVSNNYAGNVPEFSDPHFAARRAAAYRAYWENTPFRPGSVPVGNSMPIYRRLAWGSRINLHLLDTRQYRDDQACGDNFEQDCTDAFTTGRTILGAAQESWLQAGLAASNATWDVIAQQVFFARLDRDPGPGLLTSMDTWDGYAADRGRVLDMFAAGGAGGRTLNPVVLTGDVHRNYANDLYRSFDDQTVPPIGAELVATSISTSGDGSDTATATDQDLQINPHIRFANSQRGYILNRFDPTGARADYRVVPYISRTGAPVSTRASFTMTPGSPGLTRVA